MYTHEHVHTMDTQTMTVLMNMNTHELSLVLSSLEVNIDVYTLMCPKLKHMLFLHTHLPPPFFSFSEDGISASL